MKHVSALRACLVAASLLVAGCGGGGGSAPPAYSATLTLTPSVIDVTGDTSRQTPPYASVDVTMTGVTGTVYVEGTYTISGLYAVSGIVPDSTHFTLSLQFRDPPTMAAGTYTDGINLHLCSDQACAHVISATKSVTTHYTVTGAPVAAPKVTVGVATVDEQTLSFVPAAQANIPLTFENQTSLRVLDKSTTTNNAILGIMFWGPGGYTGSMGITFKPGLAIGTYHDTVTIAFCNNDSSGCQQQVAGSGTTVAVTLTVADTITGPNGYSVKFAPVSADGLAWDAQRQVIYASTRADSANAPQSIAVIDPLAGTVTSTVPLAGGPGKLAVSGDGSYLYAGQDANGTVSRLLLPGLATDITLPLPVDASVTGALRAKDIEVAPGNAHEVAIAVATPPAYSPDCRGLMLFQDAQLLATLPGNGTDAAPCSTSIQWGADSTVLYADDDGSFPSDIYHIAVGASSLVSTLMIPGDNFLYSGPIQYRGGLLYTAGGVIYDTTTGTVLGQLTTPTNQLLRGVFSPETHRVITVQDYVQGLDGIRITAFDTTTYTEVAHIDLPGLYIQQVTSGPPRTESEAWNAIRWGTDGYAVPLTDGRVLLIKGAFVGP